MKTIQMTIDEDLLNAVDMAVQQLETSRSAFLRQALQQALKQMQISALERQHTAGYKQYPVEPGEFDVWQSEQMWEEEL
ncbi:MAG: ribbon-helix-helix domain-containing protein [Chloroflexota bacterium]